MKTDSHNDPLPPTDPVWSVLGRAAPPPDAPWLAGRVLRRIRTAPQRPPLPALILQWAFPAAAAAAVAAALLAPSTLAPLEDPSPALAFEEAARFDELVAASAGWAWSEVAPVITGAH